MPFLAVIFIAVIVIILWKSGLPQAVLMLIIPLMFSALIGTATAAGLSAFATPFVGIPVGIIVFLMVLGKFMSGR